MRKLLGMALLLVALPACATARSIGDVPAETLGELGCAASGALVCSPEVTVKPLTSERAPAGVAVTREADGADAEPSPPARPPAETPGSGLSGTHPVLDTLWQPVSVQTRGVGLHWSLQPHLSVGPALEWSTERDIVLDERLTFGLTLRF